MKTWELKKIGQVCKFEGGSQPPKSQFCYEAKEGYIRLIQIRDYKSDNNIVFIPKNKAKRFCNENEIMIGRYGPPVFQILKGLHGAYNVALMKAIPNEKVLSRDFAFMFLKYSKIQDYIIHLSQRAAGQTGVSKEAIEDYPILLPPLQEQERIVSILDEAFDAIAIAKANAEKNLKNAKELFESYLKNIFSTKGDGWEEKTLNQISDNLDSKRVPITKNVRSDGSIPYYGASGIVDYVADYIFDEDLLCVSEDGANLLARTYPIAFSISGKTWVNNHAHILRFKNMVSQKFVELYLNSIKLDDFISGMAQPKLNQAMLNKIPIPFPSIPEQQTIVQKLDALSTETKRLEAIYQQKIADLEELKKSVLQKAFNGDLKTT